jgi:hypothetical protein
MRHRFVLALTVVCVLCWAGGCSRDTKDPKADNPKDIQLKPLPAPGSPGDGNKGDKGKKNTGAPVPQ